MQQPVHAPRQRRRGQSGEDLGGEGPDQQIARLPLVDAARPQVEERVLVELPDGRSVAKGIERVWIRLRNKELPIEQVRDSVTAYGWGRVSTAMLSLYDTLGAARLSDGSF